MDVEVMSWRKSRRDASVCLRAATITIYLTAEEVETNNLGSQVVLCGANRYRLLRGVAFLRTQGLTRLAEAIAADVRRQEDRQTS